MMLKISRDSWVVKLAFLGSEDSWWLPGQISLCKLFWLAVLKGSFLGLVLVMVPGLAMIFPKQTLALLILLGGAILAGAALFFAVALGFAAIDGIGHYTMVQVVKRRFCPMVELTREGRSHP